jgi:DNA-binding beta-propeller fold protein YncE
MTNGHRARKAIGAARHWVLPLLLLAGCAPRWALRSAPPPAPLQWPFAPRSAKVSYQAALTGLVSNAGAGRALRAIAFGSDPTDRGAFVLPVAVATGRDGRIAVADLGRAVVHVYVPGDRSYRQLSGAGRERLVAPVGVAFDDELTLYVTDSSGKLLAFAPDGSLKYVRGSAGETPLQRPTGITFCSGSGAIYVVDTLASRVHAFARNGSLLFSFGERGEQSGQFNFPTHAFCSAAGEIFVADSLNFRIQVFDGRGAFRAAFGRHGDGSGDLAMPKGVAVDRDGVIYVVDAMFDNVQLFNRQGDFLLTLGQRGTGFGEFWLPSGAFINEKGELYVCDTYNRRVQVFRVSEGYVSDAP